MASSFRVDPDNVLQARAAVQAAADKIRDSVNANRDDMRLEPMGGDPVSRDAAVAFTHRLQKYVTFCDDYVRELQRVADALREAALTYGYTDEDIARGFPAPQV